jgi:serine-type D-Ala-D-Ala carboxypeptidase/endopeptidase (penicillin-binding protein 4)
MNRHHTSSGRVVVNSLLVVSVLIAFVLAIRPLAGTAKEEVRKVDHSDPVHQSTGPASANIKAAIDKAIGDAKLDNARLGVSVVSLDGEVVYERNARDLFTPASNMKVYTTAVALDLLGADYRWRTSVYTDKQPDSSGTVNGDLVLYGRGAPDLVSKSQDEVDVSLSRLAADLYARGIRRVKGNVVGDDSYFRGNALGDGWQWNDIQWYFGAEASALSVNENEIDVNVFPAKSAGEKATVSTNAGVNYVEIDNRLALASPSSRPTIGLYRGLSDNKIAVWGELPSSSKGFGARLAVHNPALWAANLFADALKAQGIGLEGKTYARDSRMPPSQRFDPGKAVELANVSSRPLSEIAKRTNKYSNNLFAELILRTLGRERGAMLEIPEPPGRERGDDEAGVALIRLWMARAGIPTAGLAIHDGSGLSRLNLVTPESTVRLLIAISKTASRETFIQTLPIAGEDGTLAGRLRNVGNRLRAKTGSLTYDNSLSGYATGPDARVLAFSILCNDHLATGGSLRLIDAIATAITAETPVRAKTGEKPR